MFQIKGNSECVLGFGATDEECGFEQFFPSVRKDRSHSAFTRHQWLEMVKKGLVLEESSV